jgi:hypothetical protein
MVGRPDSAAGEAQEDATGVGREVNREVLVARKSYDAGDEILAEPALLVTGK